MTLKTHLGLFEGMGGFSVAANWAGYKTVAWCEWDSFCQQHLKYHYPASVGYGDIDHADFSFYRGKIDLLTGGFPCQPYSTAGKRLGTNDKRHKWPQMLAAVGAIRPKYVLGENVRGILNWEKGMVISAIKADLEAEGYEVEILLLPAIGIGAVHERYRTWIIGRRIDTHDFWNSHGISETEGAEIHRHQQGTDSTGAFQRPDHSDPRHPELSGWCDSEERQQSDERREARCEPSPLDGLQLSDLIDWCIVKGSSAVPRVSDSILSEAGRAGIIHLPTRSHSETSHGFYGSLSDWSDDRVTAQFRGVDDGLSSKLGSSSVFAGVRKKNPSAIETYSRWRKQALKMLGNSICPQVAYQIIMALEEAEIKYSKQNSIWLENI